MLLTLTFNIWPCKFQVLAAARALLKLNAHYETKICMFKETTVSHS